MPTPAEIAKAERLARAIASDISIYNQEKIQKGLEDDNLFELLNDEIEEGRKVFRTRNPSCENTVIFEKAIVDTIVATRANVSTKIF